MQFISSQDKHKEEPKSTPYLVFLIDLFNHLNPNLFFSIPFTSEKNN